MWVFLNDAFLSIVDDLAASPGNLSVRARVGGDIERVFPKAKVEQTPGRDYRFRASLPVGTVARALYDQVSAIDYRNFKDSVREDDRHDAYLSVWTAMFRFQRSREQSLGPHELFLRTEVYDLLKQPTAPKKPKRRGKRGGKKRKARSLRRGA